MGLHFDCNATTAASPEVIEAMLPWFGRPGANPSATHPAGREAGRAVRNARAEVAGLIGATSPSTIVFTSCGSESTITAVRSAAARRRSGKAVISTAEHSATVRAVGTCFGTPEDPGAGTVRIPVDADGHLDRSALMATLLRGETALVSLILLNNETGVITDMTGIGEACRAAGALFHVDAVQAPAKIPINVATLDCDFLSLSGHKFHGPRGIGALYVRQGVAVESLIVGGPQEGERRAGTENVPAIVGLGVAAQLAARRATDAGAQTELAALRDRLESRILTACPGSWVNGDRVQRAANTTNVGFNLASTGLDATALLALLHDQGIEVSAGSACNSQKSAPSAVLRAMGQDDNRASSALRFSLAHGGTPDAVSNEDVDACALAVIEAHQALMGLAL